MKVLYRVKPFGSEAIQFQTDEDARKICEWATNAQEVMLIVHPSGSVERLLLKPPPEIYIYGERWNVDKGDWVLKGPDGVLFVVKNEDFSDNYEVLEQLDG